MNIKEAKEQIKNAISAYLEKDELGEYVIPVERQRPIFLLGAPGIGKTAIISQITADLNIGLVNYSMTHHTRQSALGLPFIEKKVFDGKEYSISEYTMSEIIASVYELMEKTGVKEGILFLDEINCVSETLSPVMLQFLQYKTFGCHKVPAGWIVVTAGNPPEYNKSVREFDIATWDRLKKIEIEPDFDTWKEYAINMHTHPAIISYLENKRDCFYKIESTPSGKQFVTARGWSDLSDIMRIYEQKGIRIDENLIKQYLQNSVVSKNFALFYDLFVKYKADYPIDKILSGNATNETYNKLKKAQFDERIALLDLLLSNIGDTIGQILKKENVLLELRQQIQQFQKTCSCSLKKPVDVFVSQIDEIVNKIQRKNMASTITAEKRKVAMSVVAIMKQCINDLLGDNDDVLEKIKTVYYDELAKFKKKVASAQAEMTNAFAFLEKAFGNGQEMLIFVTGLTINKDVARFIGKYGCEKYYEYNKRLLIYERQNEIVSKIDELMSLDD
ncbi:MAG: AAA family ATPase [Bacilli bacterium]|nr:AAA family ATPase [Bacilli bacterium]